MSDISELKANQKALSDDMTEVKSSLKEIASVLTSLARLEEKHASTTDILSRMDTKIDDHEIRIRSAENKLAAQMWVERVIWVAVAGIISIVITSIKGLV